MSADANLVFFGLRFDATQEDVGDLETRQHHWIAKARVHGLDFYWADFSGLGASYYFFVGKKLALTGLENQMEVILSEGELVNVFGEVKSKLAGAGFEGEPRLYSQWQPA